ncbi:MAG: diaminopimelate decarboxylase [Alphaproteobacteria bacterium]
MTHLQTGFHQKNATMHVDNIALHEIAKAYGTPCYVYSASAIRTQYNALHEALKRTLPKKQALLLCYAAKANSNIAILRLLKNMGSGLEIVSEGELARGIKAGFEGRSIISTSFGKTAAEIRACLKADILQFNIEAPDELERINTIAGETGKKANVAFRLNPDITGGGHNKISTGRKEDKFGNTAQDVLALYKHAQENLDNITPVGLSMHIGSQVSQANTFKPGFEKLAEMTKTLRAQGLTVTNLDIGGGFPIIYNNEQLFDLEDYARWVKDIIAPLDVHIQTEPGRYMVGNAGILLSRVEYIKTTPARQFIVLDAGMNDLIRPAMYDAYHDIRPIQRSDAPEKTYDIVGPVCESGDIFAKQITLPEISGSDIVAIKSAGAYGFSMASNYNSRPLPAEILIDGDKISVIGKAQSIKDLMHREEIPNWL